MKQETEVQTWCIGRRSEPGHGQPVAIFSWDHQPGDIADGWLGARLVEDFSRCCRGVVVKIRPEVAGHAAAEALRELADSLDYYQSVGDHIAIQARLSRDMIPF